MIDEGDGSDSVGENIKKSVLHSFLCIITLVNVASICVRFLKDVARAERADSRVWSSGRPEGLSGPFWREGCSPGKYMSE